MSAVFCCFSHAGGYRIEVLRRATVTATPPYVLCGRRENLNSVGAYRWEHPASGTCPTNPGDPRDVFVMTCHGTIN